jgi:hypothetical protein
MDMFPDGFLLMDSDVLVRQDVSGLADSSVAFVGQERKPTRRFPVPRVLPYLCWVNTPMLKEHGMTLHRMGNMRVMFLRERDDFIEADGWTEAEEV